MVEIGLVVSEKKGLTVFELTGLALVLTSIPIYITL
jgi:hypothetical protein